MTTVAINVSTASDEQHIIDVIVLAFSADPAVRRMFPDPTQYLRNFPKFVKAFGGKAFQHESAYHIDDFSAALWLPPDVHPERNGGRAGATGGVCRDRADGEPPSA
jgi:hypothetical protein